MCVCTYIYKINTLSAFQVPLLAFTTCLFFVSSIHCVVHHLRPHPHSHQYYVGHEIFLDTTDSAFLVVFSLADPDKAKPLYWLHFIKARFQEGQSRPHVILVGSNKDVALSKDELARDESSFANEVLAEVSDMGCDCLLLVLLFYFVLYSLCVCVCVCKTLPTLFLSTYFLRDDESSTIFSTFIPACFSWIAVLYATLRLMNCASSWSAFIKL